MTTPWIVAYLALAVLVLVQSAVLLGMLRRVLPTLTRLDQAGVGTPSGHGLAKGLLPGQRPGAVELTDVSGAFVQLSDVLATKPSVVLLVSGSCEPCGELLTDLAKSPWGQPDVNLIIITVATDAVPEVASQCGGLLLRQGPGLPASEAFDSNAYPHAFAVDRSGVVRANLIPDSSASLQAVAETLRPIAGPMAMHNGRPPAGIGPGVAASISRGGSSA